MSAELAEKQDTSDPRLPSSTYSVDNYKRLITELCAHFYRIGWASGTGGGVAICVGDTIYCAPSGVQKELIHEDDIFVLNRDLDVLAGPSHLKRSACIPLFERAFHLRDAGCCIHSHSIHANLVTADPKICGSDTEFIISHQEMIKGLKRGSSGKSHEFSDSVRVPVIENTPHEHQLKDALGEAINRYPETNAVLVRRHGVYIWGKTWQEAKTMAECYHYLFNLKLEMHRHGIM